MAVGKAAITLKDNSREVNGFGFYIPELDDTNVELYNSASATRINNVLTALAVIVNVQVRSASVSLFSEVISEATPASGEAQNEKRLLLKYQDTVNPAFKGRMEIPGFDIGSYAQEGTDQIDLGDTDIAALVTALEAAAVSKLGNPIEIYEAVFVGRNS
jgi:hypothetical protein